MSDTYKESEDFVTFYIAGQLFGVPVLRVQDIINPQQITPIPLAPPEIAGSLNLRGRIVTAIDVRKRLGLAPRADKTCMSIVVENGNDLYSLMVDSVGEVLGVDASSFERNPPTLDQRFRDYSIGIYRLDGKLLVILDVNRFLDYNRGADAA
ncbi:chemotaxis protein CheW [Kiloniella laminariae]|uniref:Chemotaxis protein CheW n=1 Tax=Kiloniella laminariae TaxID=454162 RepID=A0ABT4LHH2_9PROT|nr:chemotaxis protein CheW [Kiloniella laminariae]MCZ4280539.1 chemotaxis protein CheW [Kiloniella laminariae]